MMLTSDVALLNDPMYLDIVNEFAGDSTALDESFAAAWHKLTTSAFGNDDMQGAPERLLMLQAPPKMLLLLVLQPHPVCLPAA